VATDCYRCSAKRLSWFSRMFPMNCDCSRWAQSSPQTCSVPSRFAISSSQAHKYNTGWLKFTAEVHISHHRSEVFFSIGL